MTSSTSDVVLRTPAEWLELLEPNTTIRDPDGWRRDDGVSLDDPISEADFRKRLSESTVERKRPR